MSVRHGYSSEGKAMKNILVIILALFVLLTVSMATGTPQSWRAEVVSLISHQKYKEAGDKIKEHCIQRGNGALCLTMASAYFNGETQLGIESRDFVKAAKYAKLSCDLGTEDGCTAYTAAIEGELLQHVLFEPGIENRDAQLKEAIRLGADLNATTMFTRTVLQEAISKENVEAVRLLLDNGVDVNYRVSGEDLTPLMYAINTGNNGMVSLLLERGADTTQTMKAAEYLKMGKEEANACDFANKLEKREVVTLLKCKDATNTTE